MKKKPHPLVPTFSVPQLEREVRSYFENHYGERFVASATPGRLLVTTDDTDWEEYIVEAPDYAKLVSWLQQPGWIPPPELGLMILNAEERLWLLSVCAAAAIRGPLPDTPSRLLPAQGAPAVTIEVKEACAGWDRVQHVKDPHGVVHGWDVHDEVAGELRTDCGLTFLDRGRSPDWQDTQEPLTCGVCDEHEERSAAEGRE